MTDMTPAKRLERARRAKGLMDEFLTPALAEIEHDYAEKMIFVASTTDPRAPESIARLAMGVRVTREIRGLIERHIADGAVAQSEIDRTARNGDMTPAKRRLLGISPGA